MLLLKLLIGTLSILVLAFIYEYVYKLRRTISFYKAQGVTILPGSERPFIGNAKDMSKFLTVAKSSDEPLPNIFTWVIQTLLGGKQDFKPEDHKVILLNSFGTSRLIISDPLIV